jgi:NAD(P)-dependent dehydrogenase (short-subunit alcohol dehydrogenase family)
MSLKEKVSIVTGGGQGLGRAIAIALAQKGCSIAICDLNLESATKVAQEISSMGRKAIFLKVDVSKRVEVSKMIEEVIKEFGRIDILVNNVGICQVVSIEEMIKEDNGY